MGSNHEWGIFSFGYTKKFSCDIFPNQYPCDKNNPEWSSFNFPAQKIEMKIKGVEIIFDVNI